MPIPKEYVLCAVPVIVILTTGFALRGVLYLARRSCSQPVARDVSFFFIITPCLCLIVYAGYFSELAFGTRYSSFALWTGYLANSAVVLCICCGKLWQIQTQPNQKK